VIQRVPRIIGIQAASCAPLYRAFNENLEEIPGIDKKDTVAEGIAIAEPVRGQQILEAVKKSNGRFIIVEDREIKKSLLRFCAMGFYIEPTSAATTAGLSKYLETSGPGELIVSVFTGHGLKTTETMLKILQEPS